jgi:hypothetical protein
MFVRPPDEAGQRRQLLVDRGRLDAHPTLARLYSSISTDVSERN